MISSPVQWCISQTTSMGADKGRSLLLHPRNLIICSLIQLDLILTLISQKACRQEAITHQAQKMLFHTSLYLCSRLAQKVGFALHTFLLSDMGISDILHISCFTDGTDMVLELLFTGTKTHDNM